jgi:hypothetical protein
MRYFEKNPEIGPKNRTKNAPKSLRKERVFLMATIIRHVSDFIFHYDQSTRMEQQQRKIIAMPDHQS